MRPTLLLLVAVLAGACGDHADGPSTPSPSLIIGGEPTGNAFAAVGALLYDFGDDGIDGTDQFCTGALVGSGVFLTAAHCVAWLPAGAEVFLTFAPDLLAGPLNPIPITGFAAHPDFFRGTANPPDMAVVQFNAADAAGITPLSLPPLGYLDDLAAQGGLRGRDFLNVGYGTAIAPTGIPVTTWDGKRNWSRSRFQSLQPGFLSLLMANAATKEGGDCYGDSGGPKFLEGDEETVVAVVNWGDIPCRALSVNSRLDTRRARSFLGSYVTLP